MTKIEIGWTFRQFGNFDEISEIEPSTKVRGMATAMENRKIAKEIENLHTILGPNFSFLILNER